MTDPPHIDCLNLHESQSRPTRGRTHAFRPVASACRGWNRENKGRNLSHSRTYPQPDSAETSVGRYFYQQSRRRNAATLDRTAWQQAVAHVHRKEHPEISTFHSLCVRILHRQIRHLGYPNQFAIYDRGDQEGVARSVLREIKAADALLRPATCSISSVVGKTPASDPTRPPIWPKPTRNILPPPPFAATKTP